MRAFIPALAAVCLAAPAFAADGDGRWFSGELSLEVQNDLLLSAPGGTAANALYTTIESVTRVHVTSNLSLDVGLTFEPVLAPAAGEDVWFEDHGLYVDTLQLIYQRDNWYLHGGKFTAPFGISQDAIPGLYGDILAGAYELTERVGVGAGVSLALADLATLAVSAAVFRMDGSVLSDSAITSRGRIRPRFGGPGNTEGLESFSLALDATDFAAAPGLALRASMLRQGRGAGDPDSQWAGSLGGVYRIDLDEDLALTPMLDWVHSEGAGFILGPAAGAAEDIVTAAVALDWQAWNATLAGGLLSASRSGAPDINDRFVQISVGYAFDIGVTAQFGWAYLDQDGATTHGLGALVSYLLEF